MMSSLTLDSEKASFSILNPTDLSWPPKNKTFIYLSEIDKADNIKHKVNNPMLMLWLLPLVADFYKMLAAILETASCWYGTVHIRGTE